MALVNSATITLTALASGDNANPAAMTAEYINTNTQAVQGGPVSVGTGAFENVMGGINGTNGAYLLQNFDATNFITLKIFKSGADTIYLKIPPKGMYIHNGTQLEVSETEAAFGAFVDFDQIQAIADMAACEVNIFKIQNA